MNTVNIVGRRTMDSLGFPGFPNASDRSEFPLSPQPLGQLLRFDREKHAQKIVAASYVLVKTE
jgi:hypothetical protein